MKESALVSLILKRMWYERQHIKLWRANAGKVKIEGGGWYQGNTPGCPDLIGYLKPSGQFVGIECKVGKNKQNDHQKAFQQEANTGGALYILAYSVDDVERALQALKEPPAALPHGICFEAGVPV